jgi:hypothetical protein
MIQLKPSVSRIVCWMRSNNGGFGDSGLFNSALSLGVFLLVMMLLIGCGRDPKADATSELAASFEGSPAKEDVIQANAAFEEGRYKDSLYLLHKVVGRGDLTERQKKAMAGIVGQVLQAVHDDPQLSADPQLHRLMELLIVRTMGEP